MSKFKKYKNRVVVTIVTIILFVIIGMTSAERMKITGVERAIGNILAPIEKVFFKTGKSISNTFSAIGNIGKLKDENKKLKKKVAKLEAQNREYEDVIGKTDFLKNEMALKEKTNYELLEAQVVGKEPGNWFDRFVIDKGSKDGIKKGDTVIQGVKVDKDLVQEGLVGRVVDVGDNWAKVFSIIDESSNISFKVLRTQDGGVLSGSVDNKISGYLFDNKADVIKGDKLFTSGLGGAYMKDIYIGEVKEVVKKEENLMKRAVVAPAVNFNKIYKIYVILN